MLLAVPNVSEGRDERRIAAFSDVLTGADAHVLDVHSDEVHNRSVITLTAPAPVLPDALARLAASTRYIDLTRHHGVHPRLGGLDVCPIVAHDEPMVVAVEVARATAAAIGDAARLPVYLYGAAATRGETRELPSLRRGGLPGLIERARTGLRPDAGPAAIDPHRGVVCVGARSELIAFNIWIRGDMGAAQQLAAAVRSAGGGPPGIRALGFAMGEGRAQVSMNLVDPATTGIDDAFAAVAHAARDLDVVIEATEIVGLVRERYLPAPGNEAARLLIEPGRSLELALGT